MMDRALRPSTPTLVDAEAIRTGAVQNVAPLAYGDGQVVWGSRNPGSD